MRRHGRAVLEFVGGLHRCGARPRGIAHHIVYTVEPLEGRFAGAVCDTAVAISELTRWPLVPPHWIHLPAGVTLPGTNSRESSIAGWLGHSRHIAGWGHDADPASGWLAHVRRVIGDAQ